MASQRQRKLERTLAARTHAVDLLKEGGADKKTIVEAKASAMAVSREYTEFSKAMGLPQQRERVGLALAGMEGKSNPAPKPLPSNTQAVEISASGLDKSAKSGIIKAERKAALEKIGSDELPLSINVGNQNKHIKDSHSYDQAEKKSIFYGDLELAQKLVEEYHGKGEFRFTKDGKWSKKEIVTLEKDIGITFDANTGIPKKTNRFAIHYGKKGTHVVPIEPLEEKGDKK